MRINRQPFYRFGFLLTLILIAWLSLMPNEKDALLPMPSLTASAFEMHVLAYAVAAWLGFVGFSFSLPMVFGVFLYGTLLEIAQHFVPTRAFNPFDALANMIGVLLACLIYLYLRKRRLTTAVN